MHYITYYSSLFDFYWDEKTNSRERISAKELRLQLWRISTHLILLSVIHSYLDHYHFKPFPSPVQLDQYHISFDLLQPGQLLNNYLYALLTFFGLSLGWNLAALAFNLQGYRTVAPFDNPLFTSRSASDFWGRKWNITIHETVKVRRMTFLDQCSV
jgi:D-alanyl-lipoteichoic acid acyltransferase DltB (MBOAT superfamily)